MRSSLLPLAALILWPMLSACLAAEPSDMDREPQHAVVISPGAPVRSGPGDSYYLTDTLPEATAVEVYRRQPNGWCAIRPPADSFSWVFAQHLRMLDDNLAEVTKDDVAARVGSRLSSQRDVVQVRLEAGERVAVLGHDDRESGTWYRIAPPAGEFRWVHLRDLALDGEQHAARDDFAVKTVALEEPVDGERYGVAAPPLSGTKSPGTNSKSPSPSTTSQSSQNSKWSPAKTTPPPADITPVDSGSSESDVVTGGELGKRLQQLELQLSRMVAEPPATWNTAPLEQAAEQLLAHAEGIADRNAAKATLAKIDRFSAIQRRYATTGLATNTRPAPTAGPQASDDMTPTAVAPLSEGETNTQYDAVGILRPVVSRRPGAPQFALVNAQGQVVTFITPTPDVNLQPFIGQQIGVSGSRGYIPEFRRSHVTAARVAPMNERMIR